MSIYKHPYPVVIQSSEIREKESLYYIGNKQATIADNNIIIEDEKFKGTPGLWELIVAKNPTHYLKEDLNNYKRLMIKTNALHYYYDPKKPAQEAVIA